MVVLVNGKGWSYGSVKPAVTASYFHSGTPRRTHSNIEKAPETPRQLHSPDTCTFFAEFSPRVEFMFSLSRTRIKWCSLVVVHSHYETEFFGAFLPCRKVYNAPWFLA